MLALMGGALTLAGTGCTTSSTAGLAAKVEKPDLQVAAVPAVTNMGLFLAQQNGFFSAEGLRVKIVPVVSSTSAITGQLSGMFDVTAGAYVSYILTQSKEPSTISWHILSEGSISQAHSQSVLVLGGSGIRTVADLSGKVVAANILNNVGTLLIKSMLAENNVPLSSVKLVEVPFPEMAGALTSGKVAAAWFDEPFLSETQVKTGAEPLFDTSQGATAQFPISGYMSTGKWLAKYPETAQAFVRAITRGQTLADANRRASELAVTRSIKGVDSEVAAILTFDQYPIGIDQVRVQRVANVMHEFGLIKQTFDMSVMM